MYLKISLTLLLFNLGIALHSQELVVTFTIRNAGFNVEGKFSEASIDYNFDPRKVTEASFNAQVKVATIDTGIGARDKHLMKEKYFDVDHFPLMTFKSKSVIQQAGQYFILGNLTIKGTTKELKIPLLIRDNSYEVDFSLNRRDFDVGGNSFILSDDVNIKLRLEN